MFLVPFATYCLIYYVTFISNSCSIFMIPNSIIDNIFWIYVKDCDSNDFTRSFLHRSVDNGKFD